MTMRPGESDKRGERKDHTTHGATEGGTCRAFAPLAPTPTQLRENYSDQVLNRNRA